MTDAPTLSTAPSVPVSPRLSLMMFLQYAVWGLWLPVIAQYLQAPAVGEAGGSGTGGLGFSAGQVGWILGLAGSIGAVCSPFIAGQLADRHFRTERCLAVLLFAGGIIKWYTAYQTTYSSWLLLSILYSITYMPTLALTNSLALAHLTDRERQFPKVRVWGTIGWIAAAWIFPMVWLQTDLHFQALPPFLSGDEVPNSTHRLVDSMKVSGAVSILYAIYCLFLPATPPRRDAAEPLAFAKAFDLIRRYRSFAVLVLATLPISIIHQIYFVQTAPFLSSLGLKPSQIGPAMSIGQFAEIAVMAGLGAMLARLRFKWVITIGALAYFLRYAIFGTPGLPISIIVISQALHGFCYACFFAAAYIYVDRIATSDIRHSAQTVFGIIILGIGPVLSAFVLPALLSAAKMFPQMSSYSFLWYSLAAIALVTGVLFAAFFREEVSEKPTALS
ncbi:MAG: MFS transporter [Candidatus Sumerlaeaceae bacterium]